jgi:hypothetical protein
MTSIRLFRAAACGLAVFAVSHVSPTRADKIKNPTAIFAGLDKITGRIISFEAAVDETVQFGALQLTPRLCYTRPPTEPANTTAFIEVDEVTFTNEYRRIFGGWIFASSPGLHGIEHPIYDVWLTGCKGGTQVIVDPPDPAKVDPLKPTTDPRAPAAPAARRQQPGGPGQQAQPGLVAPPLGEDGLPPVAGRPRGQIGVTAPQGVPVAPRQPTQRFFPTNPVGGGVGRDPAGSNN